MLVVTEGVSETTLEKVIVSLPGRAVRGEPPHPESQATVIAVISNSPAFRRNFAFIVMPVFIKPYRRFVCNSITKDN